MTITVDRPVFTETTGDLRKLLDNQRAAFRAEGPPSAAVRRERLDRLAFAVLSAAEELSDALDADFGHRPKAFNFGLEVVGGVAAIEHIRNGLEAWMEPVDVPGSLEAGMPTTIDVAPLGVVGVMGPWNFPVALVIQPTAEAIAAGNRVMIKFSDVDVRAGRVLAEAIAAEFDPTELLVVTGGLEAAQEFSKLPFDHMFFTGSPAVGKIVQRAAADNLVPVTLELGGKNPVVIGRDADLAFAAERLALSRMINGGQVCLCPDDLYVPTELREAFVSELQAAFLRLWPDVATDPTVTSIVNERNFDRVVGLLNDAVGHGATAIVAASPKDAAVLPDRTSRRIAPTLLLDVTDEMMISSEEVFGPLIAIREYDDIQQVIDRLAGIPAPLVAYWYGADSEDFTKFRVNTRSGGITRNDFAVHGMLPDVPFGGVGQSGMGAYHGKAGFDTFSHHRAVSESLIPGGLAGMLVSRDAMGPEAEAGAAVAAEGMLAQARARLGR